MQGCIFFYYLFCFWKELWPSDNQFVFQAWINGYFWFGGSIKGSPIIQKFTHNPKVHPCFMLLTFGSLTSYHVPHHIEYFNCGNHFPCPHCAHSTGTTVVLKRHMHYDHRMVSALKSSLLTGLLFCNYKDKKSILCLWTPTSHHQIILKKWMVVAGLGSVVYA